jgi:hypothetical protein
LRQAGLLKRTKLHYNLIIEPFSYEQSGEKWSASFPNRDAAIFPLGGLCAAVILCLALPAQPATDPVPNFAPNDHTSWHPDRPDGDNFLPPESGPGPILSRPGYPYVQTAARILRQRTRHIASPI